MICLGVQLLHCRRAPKLHANGDGLRAEFIAQSRDILSHSLPMALPAALFVMQQVRSPEASSLVCSPVPVGCPSALLHTMHGCGQLRVKTRLGNMKTCPSAGPRHRGCLPSGRCHLPDLQSELQNHADSRLCGLATGAAPHSHAVEQLAGKCIPEVTLDRRESMPCRYRVFPHTPCHMTICTLA